MRDSRDFTLRPRGRPLLRVPDSYDDVLHRLRQLENTGVIINTESPEAVYWRARIAAAGSLQNLINATPAWGRIYVPSGTYPGNISFSKPLHIYGDGESTILSGSMFFDSSRLCLEDLWVYGNGQTYGLKLGAGATSTSRCELNRVRIGGNADGTGRAPSGDGPQVGLWLNGAIVTRCSHCLFAFCNTGSGLYVNSTSATWSTNCNRFTDCTFNGNATHGIEIVEGGDGVASMMLHEFLGGNIEDNGDEDVYIRSAIGVRLEDIDFETTKTIADPKAHMNISCSNLIIDDCHGVVAGGGAVDRFFSITAGRGYIDNCRISGNYTYSDVGLVLEGSNYFEVRDGNQWWTPRVISGEESVSPRWVNNRALSRGWF